MPRQKVEQVRVLLFNSEEIGMGFNSDTGLAVGTALDFDAPTREPGQSAQSTTSIITTHESLMESLNMSAQLKGHYAFASADLKVEFSKNTGYNSASTFVVAKMVVNNQVTRGRNFRIKQDAKALLDSNRMDDFMTAFGDSFVRGVFTGGEFYAVMRITSVDTSMQTNLSVTLKAEVSGGLVGGSFDGALKEANKSERSRSEFSASFFQRGGSGEAEIGSTLSVDEIKARLHNFPNAVANHPFPYEVEVATYDTVPIPVPTKEQEDDFLLALADADQKKLKFLQIRNDLEFAAEHPEYFDNPPAPESLLSNAAIFLQAANAAIAHAVKLSRGEINPPQLFDPAKATPPIALPPVPALRKKSLGLERSFADWWVSKGDPATLRDDARLVATIGGIARQSISDFSAIADPGGDAAKTLRMQGEALAAVVNNLQSIDLSLPFNDQADRRASSVIHLPSMLPLSLTGLDLSENELVDLRGLERFTKLTSLNVATNQIRDVSPLENLTELKTLDLSRNQISDLQPLRTLINLESLNVSANNISDVSPLKNLTKLKALDLDGAGLFTPELGAPIGNPMADISALRDMPALANPFVLGDTLSVRWGLLSDGDAAQFRGTATRIGRSNRFAVHLTRGAETKDEEWTIQGISRAGDMANFVPGLTADSKLVRLFEKSTRHTSIALISDDGLQTVPAFAANNTKPTIDATVAGAVGAGGGVG